MSRESLSKERINQSQQAAPAEQNQEGKRLQAPPLHLTASTAEEVTEGQSQSLSANPSKEQRSDTFQLKKRNASGLEVTHSHIPIQRQKSNELEEEESDSEAPDLLEEVDIDTVSPPSYEVIAATTQVENSQGELTERVTNLWRRKKMRVDDAARHVANNDPQKGDPYAMHSGEAVDEDQVGARWAIYLGAWNYRGGTDLTDIRDHLKKGSPFRKALDGSYDNVVIVRNPTADQMNTRIMDTIIDLFPKLQQGNIGELTVYFEGHGGAEGLAGVDWANLTFEDMQSLGRFARDFGIHLTYILDTCNIGSLVNYAQGEQVGDLSDQISELSGPEQKTLEEHRASIKDVGTASYGIGRAINLIYWWRKELRNPDERGRIDSYFEILKTSVNNLRTHIHSNAAWLSGEAIDHIDSLLAPLQEQIDKADGRRISRRIMNRLRKPAAPLIDFLNDTIQDSLEFLRERVGESESSS